MKNRLLAPLAMLLALVAPAVALEIKSDTRPGALPPLTAPGDTAINRTDRTQFFRNADGSMVDGSLLNALPSGRKAVEQSDETDLSTIPSGGRPPQTIARRFSNRVNPFDKIPDELRDGVISGSNGVDLTAYLRAMLALDLPVDLPCGSYRFRGKLTVRANQYLGGAGFGCTKLVVGYRNVNGVDVPDLEAGTTALVELETNAQFRDLQIMLAQPDTANRARLVAYPVALDVSKASSGILANLLIGGAIDGLVCGGNCGGLSLDNIWIGAANRHFVFDGALNYVFGSKLMAWPIGFKTQNLLKLYNDGQGTCLEMGKVEAYAIEGISCSATKIRFWAGRNGGGSFGNIGLLNLDANGSTLNTEPGSGQINVGTLYSTKNAAAAQTLAMGRVANIAGGRVNIGNIDVDANGTNAAQTVFLDSILVSGGALNIGSGSILQRRGEARAILATSGRVSFGAVSFESGNANGYGRSVPYVEQGGTAEVDFGAASFRRRDNDSGLAVKFGTDTSGNRIDPGQLHGWDMSIATRNKGRYGDATLQLTLDAMGEGSVGHGYSGDSPFRKFVPVAIVKKASEALTILIPSTNLMVDSGAIYVRGLGAAFAGATVYVQTRPTGL
ncbi:hypothetical protein [Methylobacterium goesingense]|uniref:Uncharacterized protein n=1 Tax=Methylobacterium goesingense TaxID=243690 RepID=A0ABV2L630_9HYPH|nr:hypothetical protein [Methylobacterium goesingense]GJD76396.1 hypothetical protein CFIICLFH_4654 [Methylobacterium goesingense]